MFRCKLHVFGGSYKGTKALFVRRTWSRASNARPQCDPAIPSKIIPVSVYSPRRPFSNMARIRLPTDKRLSPHRALRQLGRTRRSRSMLNAEGRKTHPVVSSVRLGVNEFLTPLGLGYAFFLQCATAGFTTTSGPNTVRQLST